MAVCGWKQPANDVYDYLVLRNGPRNPRDIPVTVPIWGYTVLRSDDKTTMVQIFWDLETGQLLHAQVCTRFTPWGGWGPPTEVQKVD